MAVTTSSHPLVGHLVDGRYRVLSHLADGGMATVLLATDTRLDREVALKVMREDLAADETFVSRFRREARSAARLSHPNVVQVHDQGEDDGRIFLAMEYVAGETLRERIGTEGALTPREALDLLAPVLTGLAVAHDAGYIHRDVKPENVLISEEGRVKVADFGLARAVTSQTHTADEGVLYGTVAYLSPEQVERGIADARSDVYAAGLMLFELLTGTRALQGDSPIHIAFQHVHADIPAPSERVPGLPPELDHLVAVATHRDPDQRPRDAGEYLAEVRAVRRALTPAQLDRRPAGAPHPAGAAAPGNAATVAHARPAPTRSLTAPAHPGATGGTLPPASSSRGRLVALLLALLLVLGAGYWWYATAGPGGDVTVPDTAGQTRQQAEQTLREHDLGLEAKRAYDEDVPKGRVITSSPPARTEVGRGDELTVVFSRGPERYAVPDLAGTSRQRAETLLERRHLRVDGTTGRYDETVRKGRVVATEPDAGTELKRDSGIDLVLSKGPEPIDVPSVTGERLAAATTTLEEAGFEVDRSADAYSSDVPKGAIAGQSPADGTLPRGGTVTVTVSKGPEMVTVPKVEGMSLAEATRALESAGFEVTVQKFLGAPMDEVRASRPGGGERAEKGSTVTILVV